MNQILGLVEYLKKVSGHLEKNRGTNYHQAQDQFFSFSQKKSTPKKYYLNNKMP